MEAALELACVSIHAPHAGRDLHPVTLRCRPIVSIHAPHAGRDYAAAGIASDRPRFNPRAPRGARPCSPSLLSLRVSFNPRAPRGARQAQDNHGLVDNVFQSTRPTRGATFFLVLLVLDLHVSIHAPHAGRDDGDDHQQHAQVEFQSTRPTRGATRNVASSPSGPEFQSTRPTRGATR